MATPTHLTALLDNKYLSRDEKIFIQALINQFNADSTTSSGAAATNAADIIINAAAAAANGVLIAAHKVAINAIAPNLSQVISYDITPADISASGGATTAGVLSVAAALIEPPGVGDVYDFYAELDTSQNGANPPTGTLDITMGASTMGAITIPANANARDIKVHVRAMYLSDSTANCTYTVETFDDSGVLIVAERMVIKAVKTFFDATPDLATGLVWTDVHAAPVAGDVHFLQSYIIKTSKATYLLPPIA